MVTSLPDSQKPEAQAASLGENLSRDVSRAMVKLLKDHIGRGPSYARAHIHEDLVVVMLRGTMTEAERTLASEGEKDLVRNVRQVLNGTFRKEANAIVEGLTNRPVSAFLSDHNVDEDIVVQAFILAPRPKAPTESA
jgi:uncharacterized protein YbcI